MNKYYLYENFDVQDRKILEGATFKPPLLESDQSPGIDYIDLSTDPDTVHLMGESYFIDYLVWYNLLRDGLSDWITLTNDQKIMAIDHNIGTNTLEKVQHLMSLGLSQVEASVRLQKAFARHHVKEVEACRGRSISETLYVIVSKYLDIPEGAEFFGLTQNLYDKYVTQAIFGTEYGNSGLGLMDFIESTPGTIYENAGLEQQGFTMQNGDADSSNFVVELVNWLIWGQKL